MKSKILNLCLIITSLFGYLEWSNDSKCFLFEAEYDIIIKLLSHPISIIHPFTVLPIIGQITLLYTLFQKSPNKIMTYIGITGIGILLWFIFVIGLISQNYKIIISAIPFVFTSIITFIQLRKTNNNSFKN